MNRRGTTLVELAVVLTVLGIVGFIVGSLLYEGIRAYTLTQRRDEALERLRLAVARASRHLREAHSPQEIGTATASVFCYNTVDGRTLSFRLQGSEFIMEEPSSCPGSAGVVLASGVSNAPGMAGAFAYLLADNSVAESPSSTWDIRGVLLALRATVGGEEVVLRTQIALRNLP